MIPTTEKMLTGNWVCQSPKQNRNKVFGPEMTSSHLAGSVDQGSLIPNRGSLDPDDSSTSGDLSPNNWSMIIEHWTGGQINQLEKKYQKLVHNRCARCNLWNLWNLYNTWHFYTKLLQYWYLKISQNVVDIIDILANPVQSK